MKEETHDINEIIIRYLDGSAELEEAIASMAETIG